MADIVYMAKSAWVGLLDAIRAKSGTSGALTASSAKNAVDSIQTGSGGVVITDARYMFEDGARSSQAAEIIAMIESPTDISYMFAGAGYYNFSGHSKDDDILANVNFNSIQYAKYAFKSTSGFMDGTLKRAVSEKYPELTSAEGMFLNAKLDGVQTVSLKAPKLSSATSFFSGVKFASTVDFSGADFSALTDASYFFHTATVNHVILPENFMAKVGKAMYFLAYTSAYTDTGGILRMPKGFMSTPVTDWNSINLSYMFMGTKNVTAIDFNSDFMSSPDISSPQISTVYMMYISSLQAVIIRFSRMLPYSSQTLASGASPKIFVPRSLVDAYKTATNWASYASNIFAVEDYTADGTIDGDFDYSKAGITLSA